MVQSAIDSSSLEERIDEAKRKYQELQLQRLQLTVSTTTEDENCASVIGETVGPRPYATVKIEGCDVEAILDTGSPVYIISEEVFRRVARGGNIRSSDLKLSGVRLTDCSHQDVPVTAEVELKVSMGSGTAVHVPMFVYDGADPPCLLGLGAVMRLGLVSLAPSVEVRTAKGSSPICSVPVKVRLIGSFRIPPDHGAILKVEVQGNFQQGQPEMFQADAGWLRSNGLTAEEAVMEPDKLGRAQVMVSRRPH